jgi:hypothetical protein
LTNRSFHRRNEMALSGFKPSLNAISDQFHLSLERRSRSSRRVW